MDALKIELNQHQNLNRCHMNRFDVELDQQRMTTIVVRNSLQTIYFCYVNFNWLYCSSRFTNYSKFIVTSFVRCSLTCIGLFSWHLISLATK